MRSQRLAIRSAVQLDLGRRTTGLISPAQPADPEQPNSPLKQSPKQQQLYKDQYEKNEAGNRRGGRRLWRRHPHVPAAPRSSLPLGLGIDFLRRR